jgi:hypothetical protein
MSHKTIKDIEDEFPLTAEVIEYISRLYGERDEVSEGIFRSESDTLRIVENYLSSLTECEFFYFMENETMDFENEIHKPGTKGYATNFFDQFHGHYPEHEQNKVKDYIKVQQKLTKFGTIDKDAEGNFRFTGFEVKDVRGRVDIFIIDSLVDMLNKEKVRLQNDFLPGYDTLGYLKSKHLK